MKRFISWQVGFAFILIALSVIFYTIHYLIFHDLRHIFLYLIGDIAFLFIDVLIVMLVLHRLLVYREKQSMLKKMNMVIGTFFSEVGTELLRKCSQIDTGLAVMSRSLMIAKDWTDKDFLKARKSLQAYKGSVDSKQADLGEFKSFLLSRRQFLLSLLENPNLLEHESFTDLLWAVFHLTDELAHRTDLKMLPDSDFQHLSGDLNRAYHQLIMQWLEYIRHLQRDYPYLFSLALRTNPFDVNASVLVR
jgi:hypothetical protein